MDYRTQWLVFDLAGLRFTDCRGAQALRAAAQAAPGGCLVRVRAISSQVRRVLELLGLDLEDWRSEAGPTSACAAAHTADELVLRARRVRSCWQEAAARAGRIAEAIAATQDRVAATLISVAALRPEEADRLLALSVTARSHALRSRQWADTYRRPAGRLS